MKFVKQKIYGWMGNKKNLCDVSEKSGREFYDWQIHPYRDFFKNFYFVLVLTTLYDRWQLENEACLWMPSIKSLYI